MSGSPEMRSSKQPLERYPVLDSHDFEEYHTLVSGMSGSHERRLREAGPFHCRVHGAAWDELGLHWLSYNRPMRIVAPGDHDTCFLHLYRQGTGTYEFTHRRIAAGPGNAVVVPAEGAYAADLSALETFVVSIRKPLLEREAARRNGASPGFSPGLWALRQGAGRVLQDLVDTLRIAMECDGAGFIGHEFARRSFADALVGAVLAGQTAGTADGPGAAGESIRDVVLKDVRNFIEQNLDRQLSLGELCEFAGVGARSLQRAFRARWGLGPMAYVAQCRLDRTRELLTHPAADATVSHVAMSCGFFHLGRFAACYRERFGELPSATLRVSLDRLRR